MANYLAPGVYVEEVSSGSRPIEGVGTAVAGFVGFTEKGPISEPTLVTNWTQYVTVFGGYVDNAYLPHAVYGYFLNGGGSAYIMRLPDGREETAPRVLRAAVPASGDDKRAAFTLRTLKAAGDDDISVTVTEASQQEADTFRVDVLRNGKVEETFDNLTTKRGPNNVATVISRNSKLVELEDAKAASVVAPKKDAVVPFATTLPVPAELTAGAYVGDPIDRTGLGGFEAIDEITMVAVPDLMSAYQRGVIDAEVVKAVQLALIAHCERMSDRVAILDSPPGLNSQQVRDWRTEFAGYDSKFAALYWPWIQVMDPGSGTKISLPPSAHIAGVWARNDANRGVHKAPANENVRGVVSLQTVISRSEQELLNPLGVNCLRAFPGQGIRVWGARTLSTDPEWRYVNVRRLFNFIEESILNGTSWVVFEPNDEYLWSSVRRVVGAFLHRVWRSGALVGQSAAEAYFVKCDAENNPAELRDSGHLIVEIGVAPVKPAEFVVFRISQLPQGAALEE
ncbi:phage tail sheath family protein [Actinophytocola sp.]|jgi:hypothetical protein|uniref:phage tail sheath family protein n=1 Tax=Actinophytocola sp. TaxID=1872138 RepID=UPI002ED9AE93